MLRIIFFPFFSMNFTATLCIFNKMISRQFALSGKEEAMGLFSVIKTECPEMNFHMPSQTSKQIRKRHRPTRC